MAGAAGVMIEDQTSPKRKLYFEHFTKHLIPNLM